MKTFPPRVNRKGIACAVYSATPSGSLNSSAGMDLGQIHKELTIRRKGASATQLVHVITELCGSNGYVYLAKQTEDYQRGINEAACVVLDDTYGFGPALAFASSGGTSLRLTNIVPRDIPEIGTVEHNAILDRFARRFSTFAKGRYPGIRITTTPGRLTLESAIPGEKTRDCFKRFLAVHPRSYHPCDIRRLDTFICAAFRYSHRRIDVDRLRRYLQEILGWDNKEADWCCDRIEIGLAVLTVNSKF